MVLHCNVALVTLASTNWNSLVDFYTQLLGQKPQPYTQNIYTEFQLTGLRLGIFKPKSSDQSEFLNGGKSAMSLCLEVENLEDAIAHLHTLGYPPSGKIIIASHGREIYANDPEGNRLILYEAKSSDKVSIALRKAGTLNA